MVREETGRGKDRFKISELFADERCSKAILDFLATTEVGGTAGPPVADEGGLGVGKERWKRGRKIRGRGDYRLSSLFPFLFHISTIERRREGRGGHIVTGTLGGSFFFNILYSTNLRKIRSGGEKGFVICCHDLYRSNAEMMKQKIPIHACI